MLCPVALCVAVWCAVSCLWVGWGGGVWFVDVCCVAMLCLMHGELRCVVSFCFFFCVFCLVKVCVCVCLCLCVLCWKNHDQKLAAVSESARGLLCSVFLNE